MRSLLENREMLHGPRTLAHIIHEDVMPVRQMRALARKTTELSIVGAVAPSERSDEAR